jgi:hypothetical protein
METLKRFQVTGWTAPTPKPKESDGKEYFIGEFDSLQDAEDVKRERLRIGWGKIVIRDLERDPRK